MSDRRTYRKAVPPPPRIEFDDERLDWLNAPAPEPLPPDRLWILPAVIIGSLLVAGIAGLVLAVVEAKP